MEQHYDYIVHAHQKLFRYDLQKPPINWDSSYHSSEYSTNDNIKNQAGLLFFFDSETTAIKTAEQSLKRNHKAEFWLTKSVVNTPCRLLDLRGGATIVIINILFNSGFDLFKKGLTITGLSDSDSMDTLEPLYYQLMQNSVSGQDYNDIWLKLHAPFIASGNPYSLLGQRLTDFGNGNKFKVLLTAKEYDGYIFDESYGGSTICLINPNHLSKPNAEKFDAAKLHKWDDEYYRKLQ